MSNQLEVATLGAGCFWCVEAIFQDVIGVDRVISGYSGGQVENPTYQAVCTGETGHAEVVQIHFDPSVVSFGDLLHIFWRTHDPTTLNRQHNDVGTQYRSAIFVSSLEQRRIAAEIVKEEAESGRWRDPVVTEVAELGPFWTAEQYHQDYLDKNPGGYNCHILRDE